MRYSDWKMVPANTWRWSSFSPREIACKGTGSILINEDALDKLQALLTRLGKPLVLTSAPTLRPARSVARRKPTRSPLHYKAYW